MKVDGGRILVIGGVHRLGAAVARDLAGHGGAVAITTRRAGAELDAALDALREAGAPAAAGVTGDVSSPAGAARLVADGAVALGGLDGLVFAASGPFRPAAPQEIDEAAWDSSLDTIAKGFFFAACAARDLFVAQARDEAGTRPGGGVIVALTDLLGIQPWASFAAHGAAKAAEIHLVKQLARAWGADGVRVCGVAPGPVDLHDDEHREATLRAATKGEWERLVPPETVGAAVRFCLETVGVTGQNVIVDNGTLLTT